MFPHLTLLSLAALALAAPQTTPVKVVDVAPGYKVPFGIEAIGLNTAPVQLTASNGRVYIGGKQDQPTNCSSAQTVHDFATFIWHTDNTLWLYGQDPLHAQQVWAMDPDGLTGYSTAKESMPDDGLKPFIVDQKSRVLTFKGRGAKACPEGEDKPGVYGIWFSNAVKPGNLKECVGVQLKAYKAEARDACTYSHLPSCEEAPETCGSMKCPVGSTNCPP